MGRRGGDSDLTLKGTAARTKGRGQAQEAGRAVQGGAKRSKEELAAPRKCTEVSAGAQSCTRQTWCILQIEVCTMSTFRYVVNQEMGITIVRERSFHKLQCNEWYFLGTDATLSISAICIWECRA